VRRVRWGSGRHHGTIFQLFAPLTTHTCFWHLLHHLAPFTSFGTILHCFLHVFFFTFFSFLTRNFHFFDFFFCSAAYCDRVLLPAAPLRRGGTRGTPSLFYLFLNTRIHQFFCFGPNLRIKKSSACFGMKWLCLASIEPRPLPH
jgi:hypothetical protein